MMNKEIKRPTIGCDPEFFLVNPKGSIISAIGHIPGTKDNPHLLDTQAGLQTDNVAVEFASGVVKNVDDLITHIRGTFKEITNLLPEGHTLAVTPSTIFSDAELEDPQAKEFGCSPDFDVWSMTQNNPPTPVDPNLRSCGGHLHVGHNSLQEFSGKTMMVKLMDCFHGLVSTVLDCSKEATVRRELYGKAGCHRPTAYGIEYRVLSNYWLKHPLLVRLQYSLTEDCLNLLENGGGKELVEAIGPDNIQKTINTGDKTEALSLINTFIMYHLSTQSKNLMNSCTTIGGESIELSKAWGVDV